MKFFLQAGISLRANHFTLKKYPASTRVQEKKIPSQDLGPLQKNSFMYSGRGKKRKSMSTPNHSTPTSPLRSKMVDPLKAIIDQWITLRKQNLTNTLNEELVTFFYWTNAQVNTPFQCITLIALQREAHSVLNSEK